MSTCREALSRARILQNAQIDESKLAAGGRGKMTRQAEERRMKGNSSRTALGQMESSKGLAESAASFPKSAKSTRFVDIPAWDSVKMIQMSF